MKKKLTLILKRSFDILFSLLGLLIVWPLFLLIALLIRIFDGPKAFFRQERVGMHGEVFILYKFRTMIREMPDKPTKDVHNPEKCITKTGKFLRKTSLDELPQFLNVLNGTMSFIGPRPLIVSEKNIHQMRKEQGVYSVRPGITGLAQVSGRDTISHEDKVKYDREYVENISLYNDLKIIIRTVAAVLKGEDVVEGQIQE
ncbi:MAG: sugar transferase [Clostridiales bacterium]|nr:sugar transferase [Clostridiales bacterium]